MEKDRIDCVLGIFEDWVIFVKRSMIADIYAINYKTNVKISTGILDELDIDRRTVDLFNYIVSVKNHILINRRIGVIDIEILNISYDNGVEFAARTIRYDEYCFRSYLKKAWVGNICIRDDGVFTQCGSHSGVLKVLKRKCYEIDCRTFTDHSAELLEKRTVIKSGRKVVLKFINGTKEIYFDDSYDPEIIFSINHEENCGSILVVHKSLMYIYISDGYLIQFHTLSEEGNWGVDSYSQTAFCVNGGSDLFDSYVVIPTYT